MNRPIFVVGSPRSGTSILTWCIGEHPNILAIPESSWMGQFSVNVATSYNIGTAQGKLSALSALGISSEDFFSGFGQAITESIFSNPERLAVDYKLPLDDVKSKTRWVDGTPEYSSYIHGLLRLFPKALFIHIVRDVRDVVRSMLKFDSFHRSTGTRFVSNEEQAYRYWLRTVDACVQAEQAYGPRVIHRFFYSALIDNREAAFRSLLDFLGEPYCAKCVALLSQRVNSSNVPQEFFSEDTSTDPAVVEEATRFWKDLKEKPQAAKPSPAVAFEMRTAFVERVDYMGCLVAHMRKRGIREIDWDVSELLTRAGTH